MGAIDSVPLDSVLEEFELKGDAVLSQTSIGRAKTALSAIDTLCNLLYQRELDAANIGDDEPGLRFSPKLAMGLVKAIAVCGEYARTEIESALDVGI